ncbi:pyruvate ferredoxin oxidoreductase [Candidatus Bathyarchaeota archaeon]|nr:MAG: pyruvate ferredoxin oxidoreductase [Candidatus Bathyarchaeota archaeon]
MVVSKVLTGNYAVAHAVKLSRAQVIAAYPITPQTTIVEKLAQFVESGELKARYIRVESEHSAMAACIGASATGARAFTATASHGLLYMSEMVWWAGMGRYPMVMAVVTRAIGPPWSIWTEHNDVLAHRDCGWIIFFAEDNQEVFDLTIQAFRISEDERVLQPAMVTLDAFILSHTAAPVMMPEQSEVDNYLPPPGSRKLPYTLDIANPVTHGNLMYPDWFMEFRYQIAQAMERAKKVIVEAGREYGKMTGRYYDSLIETYKCSDANVAIVSTGSSAGDAKDAVDILRDEGYKVGAIKLRTIRPFPVEELRSVCGGLKAVGVVDRDYSYGYGGILHNEVKSAIQGLNVTTQSFIAGLGGRDITVKDFISIGKRLAEIAEKGLEEQPPIWINLKKEVIP